MSSESNRRVHPRYPLVLQVAFPGVDEVQDFTENLSESGLFIRTEREFTPGERTSLQLSFPPLLEPVVLEVEVVWRRAGSPGLPAGLAVKVPEDRPEERRKLAGLVQAFTGGSLVGGDCRILLVEDNPLMARMYSGALQDGLSNGSAVSIETVTDGRQALERLQRPPPVDLVITDRFMPFLDGLALVMRIRSEPRLRALPLVMISADDSPEAARRALALGTSVYLRKPVNLLDIVRTAEALLRRTG